MAAARVFASCLAVLASFAIGADAAAAAKPITGKLSTAGYTVIALDTDGEAASKPAKPNGKFKIKAPARRVTLHLRAADGTYAGPIVVGKKGRKGRKAIVGVKAGAELGKVKIRSGYAKLKHEPADDSVDRKRKARARKGVPIGAGVFGRIASHAAGTPGPGTDHDLDGVPGTLDVDDDGDLVLDNLDGSPAPSAAGGARGAPAPNGFNFQSGLALPLYDTANANAPGSTDPEIEAALPTFGTLGLAILPGAAELDCGGVADPDNPAGWIGGLTYCSRGGTGRVPENFNPPVGPPFPDDFDPDLDGFGTVPVTPGATGMSLLHGATTAQIGTGDLLIECVPSCREGQPEFPATLQYVFATTPALVSYTDAADPPNSATVDYPVDQGEPGTHGNGFPVGAPAGEDLKLTLTFWRPQRRPIPGEVCPPPEGQPCAPEEWIDIGGLNYRAGVQDIEGMGGANGLCPQDAFETADPNLTPTPASPAPTPGGLVDGAQDQLASEQNTLTYTLNVTTCLLGASLDPGDQFDLSFSAATSQTDRAEQGVTFELQP